MSLINIFENSDFEEIEMTPSEYTMEMAKELFLEIIRIESSVCPSSFIDMKKLILEWTTLKQKLSKICKFLNIKEFDIPYNDVTITAHYTVSTSKRFNRSLLSEKERSLFSKETKILYLRHTINNSKVETEIDDQKMKIYIGNCIGYLNIDFSKRTFNDGRLAIGQCLKLMDDIKKWMSINNLSEICMEKNDEMNVFELTTTTRRTFNQSAVPLKRKQECMELSEAWRFSHSLEAFFVRRKRKITEIN